MNDKKLVLAVLVISLFGAAMSALNLSKLNVLGGSTSDSWSVGGNLTVTGTSTFTGTTTMTGALAVNGEARAKLVELGSLTTLAATSTATTLTAAQVCDSNMIQWDTQAASSTLTLPTAANIVADCLTANGDHVSFIFDNVTTSTGSVVTITANTGIELVGTNANNDLVDGENQAIIDLWRVSATAVIAEVRELVAAD